MAIKYLRKHIDTREFHTEADSVSPQKKKQVRYRFLFEINKYNHLALEMVPVLYFFFSEKLLSHRQASIQSDPLNHFILFLAAM